ncbi:IS3 family transposase [Bacillus sp. ISL-46]|uniref:IS3 family transposase n=1 Tax=Bacillus sp. ISL-46 TaxID=2819129 RepID=UPI001BEAEC67|nr:IS3 family transposase [Bacillus sp. ISL-46]MBT2724286.1 IS3 family transposase [Bacillus sp. ISL-46]
MKKVPSNSKKGGKKAKFKVIDELKSKYPISKICKILVVSRAGYYKYIKNKGKKKKESNKDKELKEYITIIYHQHQKNYGYRKIKAELRDKYNLQVSEKIVRRLMRELGLKSQARREKRKSIKGQSHKASSAGHIYEKLLKRDFSTSKTSEKWVTDVTEIPIGSTKLYLSSLMDLHDNCILGYQISEVHDVQLVEDTLVYALKTRNKEKGLIIHSDQGMPYRSNRWKELMDEYKITPSMSRKANALDNACIESFFSFFKAERKALKIVKVIEEAKQIIHEYIDYYNHERIQGVLDYKTPKQYAATC